MIAKTQNEIEHLRTAGRILAEALRDAAGLVSPGITTAELDMLAEKRIRDGGAEPSFLGYKPSDAPYAYPTALCVSINDEVVHGIPSSNRVLEEGDVVSLDLGLSYKGYFVDHAITLCVGEGDEKAKKLISGTREALNRAIAAAKAGGTLGDIGAAVEEVADSYKLTIVEDLGGHAVGKAVHEKPFIANFGKKGQGEKIEEGMVLALEPMFSEGKGGIVLAEDEWTYKMKDGSRAAHFEHTILVTKNGREVLTAL